MGWLQDLIGHFGRHSPPEPRTVRLRPDGFELLGPDDTTAGSVRWQDVERIRTQKLDLYTTDCIVLDFDLRGGTVVRVSEEWPGFADLFGPLQAAFPTLSPHWYFEVMMPAFAANPALLFERPATAPGPDARLGA